jgi:hypothetical protein
MRHPIKRMAGAAIAAIAAISLGAIGAAESLGADAATAAPAHAARTISINDHGALHLLTKHGFTLNEQGSASGTIRGPIHVVLKIVSSSRVTAEVTISPNGGSIYGTAAASYHKGETQASFAGTMSVDRGSGSYAHAQGSGLSFKGTIASSNDAITVSVSGRLSD